MIDSDVQGAGRRPVGVERSRWIDWLTDALWAMPPTEGSTLLGPDLKQRHSDLNSRYWCCDHLRFHLLPSLPTSLGNCEASSPPPPLLLAASSSSPPRTVHIPTGSYRRTVQDELLLLDPPFRLQVSDASRLLICESISPKYHCTHTCSGNRWKPENPDPIKTRAMVDPTAEQTDRSSPGYTAASHRRQRSSISVPAPKRASHLHLDGHSPEASSTGDNRQALHPTTSRRSRFEPRDNLLSQPLPDAETDADVSDLAIGSSMGDDHRYAAPVSTENAQVAASSRHASTDEQDHHAGYTGSTHASPTRSELDFDAESEPPVSSSASETASSQLHHSNAQQKSETTILDDGMTPRMPDEESRAPEVQNEPQGKDLPPPTPDKDSSTVPEARLSSGRITPTTSSHSPSGHLQRRAWSPSLSGGPASPASTPSRAASLNLKKHSANIDHVPSSPSSSSFNTTAATPRSNRSINRKRMSIGYIMSPSPARSAADHSSIAGLSDLTSPAALRNQAALRRTSSGSNSASLHLNHSELAPSADPAASLTPRNDTASTSSPLAGTSSQTTTVMDISKDLLARIAEKERKVGELREQLRREESELKDMRRTWQSSITRELAAQAKGEEEEAARTRRARDSENMAALRAPRRKTAVQPRPEQSAVPIIEESTTTGSAGKSLPSGKEVPSAQSESKAEAAQLPVGVTDALRGFSARLPSGLSTQFNSILEGLNVPPTTPRSTDAHATASSELDLKPVNTGLSVLTEEAEGDGRSDTSSVRSPRPVDTTSAGKRQEPLERDANGVALDTKGHVMKSRPANNISDEGAAGSGGWASSWTKRIRDAAARAEKALGDAMTVEGLSPSAYSNPQKGPQDGLPRSPAVSPPLSARSPSLSPSSAGAAVPSERRGSRTRASRSKNLKAHQTWAEEENAKEKSALAELELNWLSNLVGGGGGSGSRSAPAATTTQPLPQNLQPKQRGSAMSSSGPQKLSPETLLALAAGDGLAPELVDADQSPRHRAQPSSLLD